MKSNFREIFKEMLPSLKDTSDIEIDVVLDEFIREKGFTFYGKVGKKKLAREYLRSRLTSALNANDIYSYKKGHFVFIENADASQLESFSEKADQDREAVERRKEKIEMYRNQIVMHFDDDNAFTGYSEAVGE